jgi:hypothetical protein
MQDIPGLDRYLPHKKTANASAQERCRRRCEIAKKFSIMQR